jgi:dephospho-CoA kinase
MIAADAPQQMRFQRMVQRNRPSDPKNFYDFMKLDAIDQGLNQDDSGQQVKECIKLAEYHIFNEFSIERLTDKVTFMIQQIMNKDMLNRSSSTAI